MMLEGLVTLASTALCRARVSTYLEGWRGVILRELRVQILFGR